MAEGVAIISKSPFQGLAMILHAPMPHSRMIARATSGHLHLSSPEDSDSDESFASHASMCLARKCAAPVCNCPGGSGGWPSSKRRRGPQLPSDLVMMLSTTEALTLRHRTLILRQSISGNRCRCIGINYCHCYALLKWDSFFSKDISTPPGKTIARKRKYIAGLNTLHFSLLK